jgi:hypothetical protein
MSENLTVGEVINGSISTVSANWVAAIIFVAVLTALGTALDWGLTQYASGALAQLGASDQFLGYLGVGAGLGGILFFIISIIGQYLLWESFLQRGNYIFRQGHRRFLAFIGQAILISFGIAIGLIFLIVPGLIISARWSMAQAFLIAEDQGVIESMGSSWDAVLGHTTPIALSVLIVGILGFGIAMLVGVNAFSLTEAGEISLVGSLVTQFVSQLSALFNAALGVFLFGRLRGSSEMLSGVFE